MRAPVTRSWRAEPAPDPALGILDPTPPAAVSLLQAADGAPVQVLAGLYASCGHACEANLAGLTPRRASVQVPLGVVHSRAWVTRSGSLDALAQLVQAAHEHASATGGGYAGASVSRQDSPVLGAEVYLQTDPALGMSAVATVPTGAQIKDAPVDEIDRALLCTAALAPAVEVYELRQVCGWSLQFFDRTGDLESL